MPLVNPAADSHELRALTGIRGIAACLVVCFHFSSWGELLPTLGRSPLFATSEGHLGVDMFFILSGFILSYVYHANAVRLDGHEYARFLWFRLARIYPNHLAMLLLLIALVGVARLHGAKVDGLYTLATLVPNFLLTQVWPYMPLDSANSWNFPSWSISAEWFAYLVVFPVVAYVLKFNLSSTACLLLLYVPLGGWLVGSSLTVEAFQIIRVTCEFFGGGMLFGLYLRHDEITRVCQRYLTLLFLVFVLLYTIKPDVPYFDAIVIVLMPPLLLGLTAETSLVAQCLATPFFLWLGRVSYAIYISHAIPLKLMKVVLPYQLYVHSSFPVRLFLVLSEMAMVLGFGAALYYTVEIPARNYLRKVRPKWMDRSRNEARQKVGVAG